MAKIYKDTGVKIARAIGNSSILDKAARKVEDAIKAEARRHHDTGAYERSVETSRVPGVDGVTDRLVSVGDKAAWSIEYGFTSKKGRDVPGLYIVNNAKRRF